MGGTPPATLSDFFMNKMEKDVVIPLKPKFYSRYVDTLITEERKTNQMSYLKGRTNNTIQI